MFVAGIVVQASQNWIDRQAKHPAVVIIERDLQPFESFVCLASHGVNLSDLIGKTVPARGYELGQSRVCCLTIAADVMGERQFECPKPVVGL